MCSRFTLTSKPVLVAKQFGLSKIDDFPARYNIAPTQPVAIVRVGYDGKRQFSLVRWGLIPDWVKDPGKFATLINARSETVQQKPSFRNALKYRRCLFPMNGFYEWSGPKSKRQPFYISRGEQAPFGVAGLWENWMGADGSEMESAVIITMQANAEISKIHDRMPVIIPPENYACWLDCIDGTPDQVLPLLKPVNTGFFKVRQVTTKVNNPANQGRELLLPAGQQELF